MVLDIPGDRIYNLPPFEKHQFAVLVVAANRLFTRDGSRSPEFEAEMIKLPFREPIVVMILLTKWDELFYDSKPKNVPE